MGNPLSRICNPTATSIRIYNPATFSAQSDLQSDCYEY
jgi:hypothetical protein